MNEISTIWTLLPSKNLDWAEMAPGILIWRRRKLYREMYILNGHKWTQSAANGRQQEFRLGGAKWLRKY